MQDADAENTPVQMSEEELKDSLLWLLREAPLTNKNSVVQVREYQGAPTVIAELDMLYIYGVSPDTPLAGQHPLVRWVDTSDRTCGFGFVIHTATLDIELEGTAVVRDVLDELTSDDYAQRVTPLVFKEPLEDFVQRFMQGDRRDVVRELVATLKAA